MRRGSTPEEASRTAVNRIAKYYPDFSGAVIAVNINGDYATACNGMTTFPYIVVINSTVTLETDSCVTETNSAVAKKFFYTILLIVLSVVVLIE